MMVGGAALQGIMNSKASGDQKQIAREQMDLQKQLAAMGGANTAGLQPAMERQKAALMFALLSNARPGKVEAPSHIAPHVPKLSGGVGIPEGGFSAETLKFLSPNSLFNQEQSHLSNLKQLNPQMHTPSLPNVGYTLDADAARANSEALRRAVGGRFVPFRPGQRQDNGQGPAF